MKLFACPICQEPLVLLDRTLGCRSNHHFDLSRKGYVNLLPVQNRRSKSPGDNQEMVQARSRFLEAKHYKPLAQALSSLINTRKARDTLVDLGCGEGYFTAAMSSSARETYGIDVSKAAITTASRRPASVCWAVASSTRLPLVDASFDVATVIMAPVGDDVGRILKPGGTLIRVSPGSEHLRELKARVYEAAKPHRRMSMELAGLQHVDEQRLQFSMCLGQQSQRDLLSMTPMGYRTSKARIARAEQVSELTVTGDFLIDLFAQRPDTR